MKDLSPILLFFTPDDISYIQHFKPLLKGRKALFIEQNPKIISEVEHYAQSIKCRTIISTNSTLLNLVVPAGPGGKSQSLDNWQGSIFERGGISYLFLNPLRQFYSVNYGKFLAERFVSKIIDPHTWPKTPDFSWEPATPDNIGQWYSLFKRSIAIAVDIETYSFESPSTEELETIIRCICFTGLWDDGNIHSIVLPIGEAPNEQLSYWITWMRNFCSLPIPKIFQGGLYDNFHLLCYGSPCSHYYWDTLSLFHSWYSELPKRLDFVTAFCVHNVFYWKDMVTSGRSLLEYNARDGWATMCSWMYLIQNMPQWAMNNYLMKFPQWVPALTCNLEGNAIDHAKREELGTKHIAEYTAIRSRLRTWFGEYFNPHSPVHVTKLIQFYGSSDIYSSREPDIQRFSLRHPLNARFAREILRAREVGKLISTYIKPPNFSVAAKPSKRKSYLLQHGRLFYALSPDGTDTARYNCSIGANWTGAQIQNVPESVKEMYIPDPGFEDFEIDGEQAEARCVGYYSGDKNLIETVESGRDYHAVNVERFFGIPYEQVVDESVRPRKILNKTIRDLSKRVNHGANYNMMAAMLLQIMGEENVDKAKKLLNLPGDWNRLKVCTYLLSCYEKAYPTVKTDFYQYLINCVKYTHLLVSAMGWTRYCFGNPDRNKPDLNAIAAHAPQNLSAAILNESFEEVFWKIQYKNPKDFRLKAQIHDSIKGQCRIGYRHLIAQAARLCVRPIQVKDIKGITRTMIIPVAVKIGPNWGNMTQYLIEELENSKIAA